MTKPSGVMRRRDLFRNTAIAAAGFAASRLPSLAAQQPPTGSTSAFVPGFRTFKIHDVGRNPQWRHRRAGAAAAAAAWRPAVSHLVEADCARPRKNLHRHRTRPKGIR